MSAAAQNSYDRDYWQTMLERIALALGKEGEPVQLCLIGSAACILGGMYRRTSINLDVWQPASDFDLVEIRQAVESAGLAFDPKSDLAENLPYLQMVNLVIVQTGDFSSVLMQRIGRLRVTRPPYENIIASKLTRCSVKDIQDVQFMMQNFRPDAQLIATIIKTFKGTDRELAIENLVYLEVFGA